MTQFDPLISSPTPPSASTAAVPPPGPPLHWIIRLFSSVRLGIFLLSVLFIYCSVGSVGVWVPGSLAPAHHHDWVHHIYWIIPWTQFHLRQSPWLELTEFEWFHWWPFNLLIALICTNLIVATIRRIPLKVVNLGVWMIHTGIIVLCVGSVMYFATKLEGDAPIIRRQLIIQVPGAEPVALPAQPGNELFVGGWRLQVMNIDPNWEVLTGDAKGTKSYAVMVGVQSPQHEFVRTLVAGLPEETQDAIWSGDSSRPMQRAIHAIGRPLVDDSLDIRLAHHPQDYFYLVDSTALYLREKGQREWTQRPIRGLPRYNDFVDSHDAVWPRADGRDGRLNPLRIDVRPLADGRDPLGEQPLTITSYLRYATLQDRPMPGGERHNPYLRVRIRDDREGRLIDHDLYALDPHASTAQRGMLHFRWIASEEEFEPLLTPRIPMLRIDVPEHGVSIERAVAPPASADGAGEFIVIEGTDAAYRVTALHDNLPMGDGSVVSVAEVEIRKPDRTFQRWVMSDARVPNRDMAIGETGAASVGGGMHGNELPLDDSIRMSYQPGSSRVTVVAGPDEGQLRLVLALRGATPSVQTLRVGDRAAIGGAITLEALRYIERAAPKRRAAIVPPSQRVANDRQQNSMIRVHLAGAAEPVWLHYHVYPFRDVDEALRRFRFQPREVQLADGRIIELMFSRERLALPAPVVLDDFIVTSHIGGFTGQTPSIRDWTSMVRFHDEHSRAWTSAMPISMNKPTAFGGFWYFQAQWDPPDPPRFQGDAPSNGLNFTVLGVGNRNGVYTQLAGCIIAVTGMIYAFYVKPFIKRRRQQAVAASLVRPDEAGAISPEEVATA